jgi:hypothetical protein
MKLSSKLKLLIIILNLLFTQGIFIQLPFLHSTSALGQIIPTTGTKCPEVEYTSVPPDGIPSIDNPVFLSQSQFEDSFTSEYLENIRVVGVVINGEAKAYPIDILIQHEIVNDNFNGEPVSITYCPLTGSAIVFLTSDLGGSTLGTTGTLLYNNLVFYDRDSETYYSQMYSIAWCGARDDRLQLAPLVETSWTAWKSMYPDTKVLSRDTGFVRNYDSNPYGSYDNNSYIIFPAPWQPAETPYNIFHAKELSLVLSLSYASDLETFIFPYKELEKYPVINFFQGNRSVVIFYDSNNRQAIPYLSTLPNGTILNFSEIENQVSIANDLGLKTFQDDSGTIWNMKGEAISGPFQGEILVPIAGYSAYWFAATSFFINARYFIDNVYYTQVFDGYSYNLTEYNFDNPVTQSNSIPTGVNNSIKSTPGFEPFIAILGIMSLSVFVILVKRKKD